MHVGYHLVSFHIILCLPKSFHDLPGSPVVSRTATVFLCLSVCLSLSLFVCFSLFLSPSLSVSLSLHLCLSLYLFLSHCLSFRKISTSALLTTLKPLTVWITTNWKILKEMGIPDHLTCLLRNLYAGQEATVRTGHGTTDWFRIGKEVR